MSKGGKDHLAYGVYPIMVIRPGSRNMNWLLALTFLWVLSPVAGLADQPNAADSVLSNGDFTVDRNGDQWPDEWPRAAGVTWEEDDGVRFLRLRAEKPGQATAGRMALPCGPSERPQRRMATATATTAA